jgi:hypothetical protein
MNWDTTAPDAESLKYDQLPLEKQRLLDHLVASRDFDQVLLPILHNLYRLPVTTCESCSGHLSRHDSTKVDLGKPPYVVIAEDTVSLIQDVQTQQRFRSELPRLERAINDLLGQQAVSVQLLGYIAEVPDKSEPDGYRLQRFSLDETLDQGYPYSIEFHFNAPLAEVIDGGTVLSTIWHEFSAYVDSQVGHPFADDALTCNSFNYSGGSTQ